jgi:pyruvate/2-oxoglutarate dehydrogenase complex dihydrolipoamide dehydrogenase (E3) component
MFLTERSTTLGMDKQDVTDVVVIGAGPAGVVAALRAADLGARTALVTRDEFGGMAANDGPVPVRTLAHAARLIREARQLGQYGIAVSDPVLDYSQLLARVREVAQDVRAHSTWREQIDSLGVSVFEHVGCVRFTDPHTIESATGLRLRAEKFIICTGGVSRRLDVPGFEFTNTHSDAWSLSSVPESMLVIGGGATGAQVASVFSAFGSRVQLFHRGPRILPTEDEDISSAVRTAFRGRGIEIHETFGEIESFGTTPSGVRMNYQKNDQGKCVEASLVVVAVGWQANTAQLNLAITGAKLDDLGFVVVDQHLQTTAPHIFAAGDVTGRLLLVPPAIQDGFVAATNAVRGPTTTLGDAVNPIGSFTDPEYAQVGLTEVQARAAHDVVISTIRFDSTTRTIIDGRTFGFCKLVVDRPTRKLLGCHVVGERAVEITQVAAIAMTTGMRVDELAHVPLSFPTYAGVLGRVAASVTRRLNLPDYWQLAKN